MALALLQIVAAAQAELGLFPVATSVVASTRNMDQQMLALLNALGRNLVSEREWVWQRVTHTVTTTDAISATCNIVADSPVVTLVSGNINPVQKTLWVVVGGELLPGTRVTAVTTAFGVTISVNVTPTPTVSKTNAALVFSQDTYEIASTFLHPIPMTAWDRGNHWEMYGPTSPQQNAWALNSSLVVGPRRTYEFVPPLSSIPAVRVFPPPTATEGNIVFSFDYVSSGWVMDPTGTTPYPRTAKYVADTDINIFPDPLMIAGLKYKFRLESGFDAASHVADYSRERQKAIAMDGSSHTLQMGRKRAAHIRYPNVQDGNFPARAP